MPNTKNITQARLKELLHYEPETGVFTRLTRSAQCVYIGDIAGGHDKDGYIQICVDGVQYRAHRLAFLYMLGWMPEQVDHDDHVRDNNRWGNLNPATNALNSKNHTLRCTNTSDYVGVIWHKRRRHWFSQIVINGKQVYLGSFTKKSDAIAARKAADVKYGFHENHGIKLGESNGQQSSDQPGRTCRC